MSLDTRTEAEIDRSVCECVADFVMAEAVRRGVPGLGPDVVAEDAGSGAVVLWGERQPECRYRVTVTREGQREGAPALPCPSCSGDSWAVIRAGNVVVGQGVCRCSGGTTWREA